MSLERPVARLSNRKFCVVSLATISVEVAVAVEVDRKDASDLPTGRPVAGL